MTHEFSTDACGTQNNTHSVRNDGDNGHEGGQYCNTQSQHALLHGIGEYSVLIGQSQRSAISEEQTVAMYNRPLLRTQS